MNLYLASGNAHKAREIEQTLAVLGMPSFRLLGADAVGGMPSVVEDASTFQGNARLKAQALLPMLPAGSWVLADDSGLEVAALDGRPGIHSGRYAGPEATDADNVAKLLRELGELPNRKARFVCCLLLLNKQGEEHCFLGQCVGEITRTPHGGGGFGYDPIFRPDGDSRTFAELSPEEKNRISHRAHALAQLAEFGRKGKSSQA